MLLLNKTIVITEKNKINQLVILWRGIHMKIQSEANFTVFEATSMIVGHSIGTGIIAVPFF